jgi:hypothetical protein
MLHFSDSKSMAKTLRKALAERQIEISHSDSLEIVAQQFGFANWNMLSARIEGDTEVPPLPDGWMITGQGRPNLYRIGVDPTLPGTVKIEAMDRKGIVESGAFGSLKQAISAENYRGRAVRISAELRSRGAERGVLWMRVDPAPGARPLRFDNMFERRTNGPVRGDVDWVERTIVLDVPEEAHSIHYGIMLGGAGELWARNFKLESLDPDSVEITQPKMLTEPTNLDFRGETWRA